MPTTASGITRRSSMSVSGAYREPVMPESHNFTMQKPPIRRMSTSAVPNRQDLIHGRQSATTLAHKSNNDRYREKADRTQQRLAASLAGIKELDLLREKHRQMIQRVKNQLAKSMTNLESVGSDCSDDLSVIFGSRLSFCSSTEQSETSSIIHVDDGIHRPPSPPLTDISSHRSSLSMDSGCLSLSSDPSSTGFYHQQQGSTDSSSRQGSSISKFGLVGIPLQGELTNSLAPSDDEGCVFDVTGNRKFRILNIERNPAPLPDDTASQTSSGQWLRAPYRKRKNKNLRPRPKSVHCYPEENTVLVTSKSMMPCVSPTVQTLPRPRVISQYNYPSPLHSVALRVCDAVDASALSNDEHCQISPGGKVDGSDDSIDEDDITFRANPIYIKPASPPISKRRSPNTIRHSRSFNQKPGRYQGEHRRPHSMAIPSSLATHASSTDLPRSRFGWEDVRRLLDPDFKENPLHKQWSTTSTLTESRSQDQSPRILRARSNHSSLSTICSDTSTNEAESVIMSPNCLNLSSTSIHIPPRSNPQSPSSVKRGHASHKPLTRSSSSQSTDSIRSRRNRASKTWHESDAL